LRSALVTLQIAVSMVLLTAAGLLLRSLWSLERVPLGMETEHVLTAQFVLGRQRYSREAEQIRFFRELEQRLAGLAGLEAAAISDSAPPSGPMRVRPLSAIEVEGRERRPEGTGGMVAWRYVTPGYFPALGIPILRGRRLTEQDRDPNTHSIVVSEALSRRLFPNEEPLGKRILRGPQGEWHTVIGIARDVTNAGPARPSDPEFYILRKHLPDFHFQNQEPPTGWRAASVIARTPIDPRLAAHSIRDVIRSIDPTLPVAVETMPQRLEAITARPRFNAVLLSAFAAMGVALAAIGLFGVMSVLVAQRAREIGIRVALGATPGRILGLTIAHAARWTAAGLLVGVLGSIAVARWLRSLLFQVEPTDPRVIAAALLLLCAVSVLSAAGPARRAARLDPMESLRQE
jgi:predicted permease